MKPHNAKLFARRCLCRLTDRSQSLFFEQVQKEEAALLRLPDDPTRSTMASDIAAERQFILGRLVAQVGPCRVAVM